MPTVRPELTQLFPHQSSTAPLTDTQLAQLYAYPTSIKSTVKVSPEGDGHLDSSALFVRANMVSTIDGAAAGSNGLSGTINNASDFRVFQVLRALAQVVVVGAGTARKEGYRHIKAPAIHQALRANSGLITPLEFAIVSRSGELPASLLDQTPGLPRPIVFTTERGLDRLNRDHSNVRGYVVEQDGNVDLGLLLACLQNLGLSRVLTEGGPSLLAQFIEQDLLDELCLTTVGMVQPGSSLGITSSPNSVRLPTWARLATLLYGQDTLMARWSLGSSGPRTK